jgi:hypothetical protein
VGPDRRYDRDVLAARPVRAAVPVVEAEPDLVVEDAGSGFCGAVVEFEAGAVVLEDRRGARRTFPLPGDFLLDGAPVALQRPRAASKPAGSTVAGAPERRRTASGSVAVEARRAVVARASRIWVEGVHDAELVERVWGDDLRVEGVVVEPLSGIDGLVAAVAGFGPGPGRRLGVLVDHLVPGSKESRIAARVGGEYVLVAGHPYVDVWSAVRPAVLGLAAWPEVPPGRPWKEGVCAALGRPDPATFWRELLGRVRTWRDLETPLVTAVERLIDHATAAG